ncbi:NAD(P)/FAD-dependent oxidoreductase [Sphingosinicella soli]|uniref:Glycine/D-amino acid oxidase-like deaminating enzyme n=1 Tax=Sphingosinicella soli TaxID=333708 RepID=A0A7W7B2X4_9SPHN|nr:FAD-binding oxidoreductase [Sphingosinicella soli]MBB4633027.1 glycine/D-amino acid oxidase-like deaminating enzyme [Sphingosinicella soli]
MPDVWTIENAPRFERLETNTAADVAIIGAGYSGLVAALDLLARGVSVVVVDAAAPGSGASGRNAGHFAPMMLGSKKNPDDVMKALGPVRGERWNRRVAGSGRTLGDFTAAIACDLRPGYLCVSRTAASLDRARTKFAAWERYGGVFTALDADETASRVGTDRYAGGILLPEGGTLHPLKFVLGLAAFVRAGGGSIHGETPATAIERHGHAWRVRTPRGHIDAAHVLLATGASAPLFPEMAGTVYPVGCSIAATAPLSVSPMPGTHAFIDLDDPAIFSPATDAEQRLVVSALSETRHPALPAAARPAERRLARTYPQFAPRFESLSSGTIGVTPDGLPRLFRLGDTLHALAGCNGFGLTLGIAAAREAAAMIGGTPEDDLALPILDPAALPGHKMLPWFMRAVAVPLMNRLG